MSPLTVPLTLIISATLLASGKAAPSTTIFPDDVADSQPADTAPRLHSRRGTERRPYPRPGDRADILLPDKEGETARPFVVPDNPPDRYSGDSMRRAVTLEEPAVIPDNPRPRLSPDHPQERPDHSAITADHPAVAADHPAIRPDYVTGRLQAVAPDSPPRRPGSTHPEPQHTPGYSPHQSEVSEKSSSVGGVSASSSSGGSGSNSSGSSSSSTGGDGSSSSSCSGGQLVIDPHTLQVVCQHVALHVVVFDPPQVRCPAGSHLDLSGQCREELVQMWRESLYAQRGSAARALWGARCPLGFTKTAEGLCKNYAVLTGNQRATTSNPSTQEQPAVGRGQTSSTSTREH